VANVDRAWWKRGLLHRLITGASGLITVGTANEQFYREIGVSDIPQHRGKHFVDGERLAKQFSERNPLRVQIREKWNIPEENLCLLYCGKLTHEKQIFDLFESLKIIQTRNKDLAISLLVVGDGELMTPAKEFVDVNDLPVSFTGFLNQSQIIDAYVACDILVLCSQSETWGLVVNEVMTVGKPAIVSSKVGCADDLVVDEQTGLIFPFGDTEALADAILRMCDTDLRNYLGVNARCWVTEHYSLEQASESLVASLQALQR
jgi:glycosyltransferase involved in cell wall biosynthesis